LLRTPAGDEIVFDVVPNHVGPKHPGREAAVTGLVSRDGEASPEFVAAGERTFYGEPENQGHDLFEALVDPHAPQRLRRNLTEDVRGSSSDMIRKIRWSRSICCRTQIWWTEDSGLDGFRVDTFPYVSREFWARWHAGLRRIYPRLTT